MKIYDISIPLAPGVANWPGDTPYLHQWSWRRSEGATVNVSQIGLSVHGGTHIDAPYHYADAGKTVDQLSLHAFFGPARVVDVRSRERIRRADLEGIDFADTPRVLLRTDAWTDYSKFPESFPVIDEDVPELLAKQGVILLGVDVPSVDEMTSKDLPVHHALDAHDIRILESLVLSRVPAGAYQLMALPLNIVGSDGAPVRAVLCELPANH